MASKTTVQFLIWFFLALQTMLFVHELSHVLIATICQVQITYLDIVPLKIPSMLFESSRFSSLIVWSGVLGGSVFPLILMPLWRIQKWQIGFFLKTWSQFCLMANGAYLLLGGLETYSDSGLLKTAGWPIWILVVVGGAMAVLGYRFLSRSLSQKWKSEFLSEINWTTIGFWATGFAAWIGIQFGLAIIMAK